MSNLVGNKVDMSLDDIIKLTKNQKRNQLRTTNRRSRGNRFPVADGTLRGRGVIRNRGRGAGRGIKKTVNPIKQFHSNLQRGRRGQRPGRGINRTISGTRPLIQNNISQQNVQGNTRRRGARGRNLVFTNNRLRQQTTQQLTFAQQQTVPQSQRLNKVRQQAALLREKQLAIKNLQQAQKNVQTINMAIQKTSRENVVNQQRGINTIHTSQPRGRGRRKLLTSLTRQGIQGNNLLNNTPPTRQLSNTSVTITNLSAISAVATTSGEKRRRWRKNNKSQVVTNAFNIQVANQNLQPVRIQQSSIMNELKMLKPAVTTTYKFQKSVFATPATGVSLNDRFSGTSFTDGDNGVPDGRKVFI